MKKLLPLLLLIGCATTAGSAVVRGRVVDRDSQGPVEGVKVVFKSPTGSVSGVTDKRGNYEVQVPPGYYDVMFQFQDDLVSQKLSVHDGAKLTLDAAVQATGGDDEMMMRELQRKQQPSTWQPTGGGGR